MSLPVHRSHGGAYNTLVAPQIQIQTGPMNPCIPSFELGPQAILHDPPARIRFKLHRAVPCLHVLQGAECREAEPTLIDFERRNAAVRIDVESAGLARSRLLRRRGGTAGPS